MTPFPGQDTDTISKDQRAIEPPPLADNQMIHEGYKQDPGNIWAWILIVAAVSALIWGALYQYNNYIQASGEPRPFLHVTNREMSRFLWQNPEGMRANVRSKTGYLPAFAVGEGMRLDPSLADEWAVAPPELLFRYHTWQRLLGNIWFPRPILAQRFMTFLQEAPEWSPKYWKSAPASYGEFVDSLNSRSTIDLSALQLSTLPQEVRIAFQGWQNFRFEGKEIESMQPTYKQVEQFLTSYPNYRRPYWQNILDTRESRYLGSLAGHASDESLVPREELAPFLKVALYNAQNSTVKEEKAPPLAPTPAPATSPAPAAAPAKEAARPPES